MRSPRHPAHEDAAQLQRATHLVVLQHGLLGSTHDFARFVEIFRSPFQADELLLHTGESNATSFFQTYDGVDQGGERLADEIQQLAAKMPKLQKLSMIGHSLGGLYNRYCIGLLLSRGFFDNVEPVVGADYVQLVVQALEVADWVFEQNFVTLATPHLGIRRPRRGATNVVFNALMPKIFSRTGAQLTLIDEASEETQALSTASRVFMDKDFHPAWSEVKGPLLVSLPGAGKTHHDQEAFELYDCALSERRLQVFAHEEDGVANELKFEVDLSCTDVTILLPNGKKTGDDAGYYSSFIGWGQSGEDEKTDEFGNFDIQIRWTAESSGIETNICVLRIPEEDVHREWRWLVALSNTSFGVRCVTTGESAKKRKHGEPTAPPLLSCLTRGQFMQALQMFKARTLYSSIFFDMQVPYTCAAVRAFNPYRLSGREFLMSPIYTHIAFDSLKSARKLRDTIPLKIKRLALKYMTPHHTAAASLSNDEEHPSSGQDVEESGLSNTSSTPSSSRSTRRHASDPGRKTSSHSSDSGRHRHHFHGRHRGKTVGSAPSKHSAGTRPEPFVEGDVILDQLPYGFTADVEQDELRGMLLSVQSVGWRRIDVLFGGIFSHEHIIAKRANPDKPLDSGIDVVHHVMDTFLL